MLHTAVLPSNSHPANLKEDSKELQKAKKQLQRVKELQQILNSEIKGHEKKANNTNSDPKGQNSQTRPSASRHHQHSGNPFKDAAKAWGNQQKQLREMRMEASQTK